MVEIPLHSRVPAHASSLRPEGGGLSGFKSEYRVKMLRCADTVQMSRQGTEGGEQDRKGGGKLEVSDWGVGVSSGL